MKKLQLIGSSIVLVTLLPACSLLEQYAWCDDTGGYETQCPGDDEKMAKIELKEKVKKVEQSPLFKPDINFQTLGEYTEQMVHVLENKLSSLGINGIIAVPPFISLASELPNQDAITRDLPEFFIADLQNTGFPVAEYHLTSDHINTSEDFADLVSDLKSSQDFGYLLKGTIRSNENGLMLYVKVIDLKSSLVVASTAKFLPQYLITSS